MTETTIKVEGMSCQHCVMRVKKAIDALKGVQSSDVQIGTVKVTFNDQEVLKSEIEKAIASSGYKVASSS